MHEEVSPRLAGGGLIALLITALSLVLFACSFASARGYQGLTFAAMAALALLTVMVLLSGAPAARRTASAQQSIALTFAGASVLAPYDGAVVGVVCGISAVVIVSLILGLVGEQQLSGLIRFALITGAIGMSAGGAAALPLWPAASVGLLISGLSLGLAFAGSWLRQAANGVFERGLVVPARVGAAPRLGRVKAVKRGRKLSGVLGAIEWAAIAAIRLGYRTFDGGILGAQWLLDVTFRSIRGIEKRIRRFAVRLGQVARQDYRLMRSWIQTTVTLLDNRFLPAVFGMLLFFGAGLALARVSVELNRYAGSGDGFAAGGWTQLGLICGLLIAAVIGHVMACATYGDDYLTALQSVGNFVFLAVPVAVVMVSLVALSASLGLPVLANLPGVGELLGEGPYTFGPASAIATAIFAALVAFVVYKIREPADDSAEKDEASVGELLKRLLGSFRELQVAPVLPFIAIAVAASLLTFAAPWIFTA